MFFLFIARERKLLFSFNCNEVLYFYEFARLTPFLGACFDLGFTTEGLV